MARDIFNEPNLWRFEDLEKDKIELAGKYANREIQDDDENQGGFLSKVLSVLPCGGGDENKNNPDANKGKDKNEVKEAEAKEEEDSSEESSEEDESFLSDDENNKGQGGNFDKCKTF